MQSIGLNPKILSTANTLLGHDMSYLQTNEARFPPTTPVQSWVENGTLQWDVPANSIQHDVMSECYFDVVWRPVLIVGGEQPRTTFTGGSAFEAVTAVNASSIVPNTLKYTPGVTPQTGALDASGSAPIISQPINYGAQIVLPLPAASGFVPSQGFFHDLFSDFVTTTRNTSDIRTIATTAGGFQYTSKILELLDSAKPRYGTAVLSSTFKYDSKGLAGTHGLPGGTTTNTQNPSDWNYPAWSATSSTALGNFITTGSTKTPTIVDPTRLAVGTSTVHNLNYVPAGDLNAHPLAIFQTDFLMRQAMDNIGQSGIKHNQPIGYAVTTENDEWLHLSLTVGRENPDVYNLSNVYPFHNENAFSELSNINSAFDQLWWTNSFKSFTFTSFQQSSNWSPFGESNGGIRTHLPLSTIFALAGHSDDLSADVRTCALYRNRQVAGLQKYYTSVAWDTALTPAQFSLYMTDTKTLGVNQTTDMNQVWYRNAYRPKDGIFGIEYDWPAYAPKSFQLKLGNFQQAWVGCPMHDFNLLSPMMFDSLAEQIPCMRKVPLNAINNPIDNARFMVDRLAYSYYDGAYLRAFSPLYNSKIKADVAYGIEFKRFDLIMHRHMVSTEVEANVRRTIMELGLARYAVRRAACNIKQLPPGTQYDGVLFENTSADLIIIAVMRNQALSFNQNTADTQLSTWCDKYAADNAAKHTQNLIKSRLRGAKYIDSFCSAPGDYIRVPSVDTLYHGTVKALPWGSPSLKIVEQYLLVNGLKEPNLGYQPDAATSIEDGRNLVQFGSDRIYKQVINELVGAGYPEVAFGLSRQTWESNVRIFPYNLTPSKFPVKAQGSNLPNKKNIAISMTFGEEVPANMYSVVAIAITQNTILEMDASGNANWLY